MPLGHSTFSKRQKEHMQKRQEKAERKKQRSVDKKGLGPEIDWASAVNESPPEEDDDVLEPAALVKSYPSGAERRTNS